MAGYGINAFETVPNPRKYLGKIEGRYGGRVYRYRIGDYLAYPSFTEALLVIIVIQVGYRKNIIPKLHGLSKEGGK